MVSKTTLILLAIVFFVVLEATTRRTTTRRTTTRRTTTRRTTTPRRTTTRRTTTRRTTTPRRTTPVPMKGGPLPDYPNQVKWTMCEEYCQGYVKSPSTGYSFLNNKWELCECQIAQASAFWSQTPCFDDCVLNCYKTNGACGINRSNNPWYTGACCSQNTSQWQQICYGTHPNRGLCYCVDGGCLVGVVFPNLTLPTRPTTPATTTTTTGGGVIITGTVTTTTTTTGGVTGIGGFGKKK